jgi:lysophospholipase L1-like esterase
MLKRVLGYVLRSLFALVVFLVTGEVLVRTFDVVDRLNGYHRALYTWGPSVELPYVLRPGLETTHFGIPVRVNAFGLRGPEIAEAPAAGGRRVLMLGDSILFGTGLAEQDTLSSALEARLNDGGAPIYEVLNAGVPGYDTVAEARQLERLAVSLRPWAAVVAVSLNDYADAPRLTPVGVLTRRIEAPKLVDHSEFLTLFRWGLDYRAGALGHQFLQRAETEYARGDPEKMARAGIAVDRTVEKEHLGFYAAPEPARLARIQRGLADMRSLAAQRRMPLLVAIFPEGFQVGVPEPDLTPQRVLSDLCRATGVTCLDLYAAFAAAGGELFQDTQHPNARGQIVASAAIAEALLRQASSTAGNTDGPPTS